MPTMSNSNAILDEPLARAREFATQGRIDEAERLYQGILAQAPQLPEALNFLAMCALARRETANATQWLERARAAAPDNAETLKNLGLAYRAGGQIQAAADALQDALRLAPEYFLARLHLAGLLDQLGREDDALPQYFRAINDAQALGLWLSEATTPPGLRVPVVQAMRLIDGGRERLFANSYAPLREKYGPAALRRVEQALRIYLGSEAALYPDPRQKPVFLFFPGLDSRPYFDRALFPWLTALEQETDAIRAEMLAMLQMDYGFEPFLRGRKEALDTKLSGTRGAPMWNGFFFYRHGQRYDDNCARCPHTIGVLDSLPIVRIREHAPEVLYSVLTPGSHILPHRGVTNTRLVTHLPLIVPDDCALRVGGEDHHWREGRCVVFDDTYEHEAWNRSEHTRVVLILDTWHPELSEVERLAITDLVGAIGDFNQRAGVR